jgi:hypothetical protein
LDAYTKYIAQTAQMAEKYGVKSMMLNWGTPDFPLKVAALV